MHKQLSRRGFVAGSAALAGAACCAAARERKPAQIVISLDLEMSREYPRRDMREWDYEKGNLDEATKRYALEAGRLAKELGATIHYFCVGRVLEQPNIDWLRELAEMGHSIGNHTYDHVNVLAKTVEEAQFRFRRAPWLARGMTADELIRDNIRMTGVALKQRAGITASGFRTPGGFSEGLSGRPDVQRMLLDLGFAWVSSKYPRHATGKPKEEPTAEVIADIVRAQSEAQPFKYESGLVEVPMSPISDVGAFRTNYWKLVWFLRAIGAGVEWAIRTGGVFDFLAHPSCLVVEDPKFETIRMICETVKAAGERARITTLDAVAKSVV
jgi:peptidoglycan/xylan/chitin deacetylase (PgdA/CDA1 family)